MEGVPDGPVYGVFQPLKGLDPGDGRAVGGGRHSDGAR